MMSHATGLTNEDADPSIPRSVITNQSSDAGIQSFSSSPGMSILDIDPGARRISSSSNLSNQEIETGIKRLLGLELLSSSGLDDQESVGLNQSIEQPRMASDTDSSLGTQTVPEVLNTSLPGRVFSDSNSSRSLQLGHVGQLPCSSDSDSPMKASGFRHTENQQLNVSLTVTDGSGNSKNSSRSPASVPNLHTHSTPELKKHRQRGAETPENLYSPVQYSEYMEYSPSQGRMVLQQAIRPLLPVAQLSRAELDAAKKKRKRRRKKKGGKNDVDGESDEEELITKYQEQLNFNTVPLIYPPANVTAPGGLVRFPATPPVPIPPRHGDVQQKSTYRMQTPSLSPHYPLMTPPGHLPPHSHPGILLMWGRVEAEHPEFKPNEEVALELQKHYIYPLKKKSVRFPLARYFCRLCEYHCDTLFVCHKHVNDTRHRRLKENTEMNILLRVLPSPTSAQASRISSILKAVVQQHGEDEPGYATRRNIVEKLDSIVREQLAGCYVQLYGSSKSGFALKTSDVNIDLVVPSDISAPKMLISVYNIISSEPSFLDVKKDFSAKIPSILFTHEPSGLNCQISLNNAMAFSTTCLLEQYNKIDPRVHILGVAFQHWAQLCKMNQQDQGSLPSYSFILMLVYFLQQLENPVLPVLHELVKNSRESDTYLNASDVHPDMWTCRNSANIGELWLRLFKFYILEFEANKHVISIRHSYHVTRQEKNWSSKRLAIEDPFSVKRNLSRSMSNSAVYLYIMDSFKATYKYFGIPQTHHGPLFDKVPEVEEDTVETSTPTRSRTDSSRLLSVIEDVASHKTGEGSEDDHETTEDEGLECDMSDVEQEISKDEQKQANSEEDEVVDTERLVPDVEESEANQNKEPTVERKDPAKKEEELHSSLKKVKMQQVLADLIKDVNEDDLLYCFEVATFTRGQSPPIYCSLCQKEGHLKSNCPEEELPPVKPLPPMKPEFMKQLDDVCKQILEEWSPSEDELRTRQTILKELQNYIEQYFPHANLELFGSSCNGFGFKYSDMDICLTFRNSKDGKELNFIEIIESLSKILRRNRNLCNVVPITTAKVPIVKFSFFKQRVDADISLYNTLAQHNTRMLCTYSQIDQRVKVLGFTIKLFAKLCNICDASRGSLSSYAYTLMVLYFLQQTEPPVLPVLQELYDHRKPKPELIIDEWNAWFFDDLSQLPKVWSEYGRNKETVGELWLGLLKFYTHEFDLKENVISIRQRAPLTRFEKLWNSNCIAIEDPFDLNHNLGAGISRKMNCYIMKAFIRGREVFGTSRDTIPRGYSSLQDFLFDPEFLTDGALPPNDRGCRICGKIGHMMKDCPRRVKKKDKREKGTPNDLPRGGQRKKNLERSPEKEVTSRPSPKMGTVRMKQEILEKPVRSIHQQPPHNKKDHKVYAPAKSQMRSQDEVTRSKNQDENQKQGDQKPMERDSKTLTAGQSGVDFLQMFQQIQQSPTTNQPPPYLLQQQIMLQSNPSASQSHLPVPPPPGFSAPGGMTFHQPKQSYSLGPEPPGAFQSSPLYPPPSYTDIRQYQRPQYPIQMISQPMRVPYEQGHPLYPPTFQLQGPTYVNMNVSTIYPHPPTADQSAATSPGMQPCSPAVMSPPQFLPGTSPDPHQRRY